MRISRGALVWGLTLILLGVFLLAEQQGFIRVLVPGWTWLFGGLGVLCLLTAFFYRSLWGLLFPGFILLGLAATIFLSTGASAPGNVAGAVFLASIALPFWITALLSRSNWWAIIPAGVITTLAIMPLLSEARLDGQVTGAIFFLGLGLTFVLMRLWALGRPGTGWAWYPAFILGGIGLVILASSNSRLWPVVVIIAGAVLLIRALLPRQSAPATPPEPEAKG